MNTIAALNFQVKRVRPQEPVAWFVLAAGVLSLLLSSYSLMSVDKHVAFLADEQTSLDQSIAQRRKKTINTGHDAHKDIRARDVLTLIDFPWRSILSGVETLNGEQINATKFDGVAKDHRVAITLVASDYATANAAVDRLKETPGVVAWRIGSISRTPAGLRAQVTGTVQ